MKGRCLAALLSLGLAGASQAGSALQQLELAADAGANRDSATSVDIVLAYSPQVLALLPAGGPQWFAAKSALLASAAGALEVVSLQLPPATAAARVALPQKHRKAVAVLLYAGFMAPQGQGALRLDGLRCARVVLEAETIALSACKAR